MKKNTYSKVLCVILSSLVLLSTSPFYAFATDVGVTRRKMSSETIAKVNELADNDKLDVWKGCQLNSKAIGRTDYCVSRYRVNNYLGRILYYTPLYYERRFFYES